MLAKARCGICSKIFLINVVVAANSFGIKSEEHTCPYCGAKTNYDVPGPNPLTA